jgi:hypothetical protein
LTLEGLEEGQWRRLDESDLQRVFGAGA